MKHLTSRGFLENLLIDIKRQTIKNKGEKKLKNWHPCHLVLVGCSSIIILVLVVAGLEVEDEQHNTL